MGILKGFENRIVVIDGAMGTQLQERGLKTGQLPEQLNFTHPEAIVEIHRLYAEAGADIITTNTFGANRHKLSGAGLEVDAVVRQAVALARKGAPGKKVALDLGPIGELMKPMGTLDFEEAVALYAEQVQAGSEADLILIETIADLQEARAAIFAARENSQLPIWCSLTFSDNGRTLSGADPVTAVMVLQDLGIEAIGINCSLGPDEIKPLIQAFLSVARIPVFVQPNAGLPVLVDQQTVFPEKPEDFSTKINEMAVMGVRAVGGCCGTSPEFIRQVSDALKGISVRAPQGKAIAAVCSGSTTLTFDKRVRVIGERINPTGKKALKEALKSRNWEYALQEAVKQLEAGAEILDVNAGMPGIDEKEAVLSILSLLEGAVQCPLQMDSADPAVLEAATRRTCGKVLLNSVNGKQSSMDTILPVAARYGANVVALMLDEDGIPADAEKRIAIAERIITEAGKYGIGPERIFVDCLVLTASAEQRQVRETLNAIRAIKARWPVHTVLGASNVSFGLPNRSILNRTFMAMALEAGLDAPITDPLAEGIMDTIRSYEVLSGNDQDSARFIGIYGGQEPQKTGVQTEKRTLEQCVSAGLREEAEKRTAELLENNAPLAVVDGYLIPALEKVGKDFESGRIFLPQLLKSAEAVKGAFDLVREAIHKAGGVQVSKGKLALATVHGDIHDIGKNIVKVLLENYGYDVIDLGKDVPTEKVLEAIRTHDLKVVGLSALMTTTVISMEKTIQAIRAEFPQCQIFVGGAVLTADYAAKIQAHYYCKDAQESVRVAGEIFGA